MANTELITCAQLKQSLNEWHSMNAREVKHKVVIDHLSIVIPSILSLKLGNVISAWQARRLSEFKAMDSKLRQLMLSFRTSKHKHQSPSDCATMAMDWSGYGGYAAPTLGDDIEDDEDFYGSEQDQNHMNGNDHMQTAAGATAHDMVGFSQPLVKFTDLNIRYSLPQPCRQYLAPYNQITMHP